MTLSVKDLTVEYYSDGAYHSALDSVSIGVARSEALGVVGESGSGKSTLASALLGLLPANSRSSGRIELDGTRLDTMSQKSWRTVRGRRIGLVLQDSLAAMNPSFTVGAQLAEIIRLHSPEVSRNAVRERVHHALSEVSISPDHVTAYPHQLSGGMRQRVMIAAALLPEPDYVIADEATSDLDVVSQLRVLDLIKEIHERREIGLLVVSHSLGVIRHMCSNVAVLYRGNLVESGECSKVLSDPQHWYTKGMVRVSRRDRNAEGRFETLPSRGLVTQDLPAAGGGRGD